MEEPQIDTNNNNNMDSGIESENEKKMEDPNGENSKEEDVLEVNPTNNENQEQDLSYLKGDEEYVPNKNKKASSRKKKTSSAKKSSKKKEPLIFDKSIFTVDDSDDEGHQNKNKLHTIDTGELNKTYMSALNTYKMSKSKKRKDRQNQMNLEDNSQYLTPAQKILLSGSTSTKQIDTSLNADPANLVSDGNSNQRFQIDAESGVSRKEYHVFKDYHAMLNLTDVAYGVHGHNKFYLLQVYEPNQSINKSYYHVFFKWGRVGAKKPQSKLLQFYNKLDAMICFEDKFYDKTRNKWQEKASFKQVSGKYHLIEAGGNQNTLAKDVKIDQELRRIVKEGIDRPTNLDSAVKDLMYLVWDIDRMQKAMIDMNFDLDKFPLGKLTKGQIQKGFTILTQIQKVLISKKKSDAALVKLSNDFYSSIPQNYGMKCPPLINHIMRVREKNQLLETLADIEFSHSYLISSIKDLKEKNPCDVFYALLKCNICSLEKNDEEYKLIQAALLTTHGPTHDTYKMEIDKIYKVERPNETIRYYPMKNLKNKRLLWHGSRMTNFVGILMNGLKIAPPEAPSTGYMFGKGIYFSDVSSKAANYCNATKFSPEGLLLLCECALGESYKIYGAEGFKKPPFGFHSVTGVGQMEPTPAGARDFTQLQNNNEMTEEELEKGIRFDTGVIMDNKNLKMEGNVDINTDLIYNEYIVYDLAQVKIRYLLKMKFHFNN